MSKHATPKQVILHSPSLHSWASPRHMWPICLPMPANHGFQPQIEWTLREKSSLKNLSQWAGWRAYCTWKTLLGTCSKLPFKRFEIYLTFKLVINKMYSSTKCYTKRIDLWIACPGSNLTLSYFQWIAIQISARCKICQVTMGRPLVFRALVQGFVKSSTYHSILWWICRHHKLIFSVTWKVAKRTG